MFRFFENRLPPYPAAEPQLPPTGFTAFLWSCTHGMRGWILLLTLSSAASFILLAGELDTWLMVAGLVFGGMFAAPFAAYLCKRIPARTLMTIVGCLITLISAFNIYKALA